MSDEPGAAASEEDRLTLVPFTPADAPLLAQWLDRPHVRRWHRDAAERIAWARGPPPGAAQALIALGARPIGYLRRAAVERQALDAL